MHNWRTVRIIEKIHPDEVEVTHVVGASEGEMAGRILKALMNNSPV